MPTLIEGESEKEIKQKQDNHMDEEIRIDVMEILRKIIAIRKTIYKAAGIGLVIGIIIAISIPKQYTVEVTLSPEIRLHSSTKEKILRPNMYSMSYFHLSIQKFPLWKVPVKKEWKKRYRQIKKHSEHQYHLP